MKVLGSAYTRTYSILTIEHDCNFGKNGQQICMYILYVLGNEFNNP